MELSAETSQSLSQWAQTFERWWIFGLLSCRLRRPWPTLADLGYLRMQSAPPRRRWRLRSVFFFHFLAFYPFLSFSHVFGNSLPPSLPGPADADPPLQDLCVWPVGFQRYTCCFWNVVWIQAASCLVFASTAYFFLMTWSLMVLVDGFRDGVMNLWPPCSWLVCRLCVASRVVSVVLQFKSCALHFILICNWDVFCAAMCVSVFLLFWSCRTVDLPSLLPLMVSADIV